MNILQNNYMVAKAYYETLKEAEKDIEKKIEIEMGIDLYDIDFSQENNPEVKKYLDLSHKYNQEIIKDIPYNRVLSADARKILREAEEQLFDFIERNLPKNFPVKKEDIKNIKLHWKYRQKLIDLAMMTNFD